MSNLRVIFCLFFNYWKVVAERGTELSGLKVTIATSSIFNILRAEWEKWLVYREIEIFNSCFRLYA